MKTKRLRNYTSILNVKTVTMYAVILLLLSSQAYAQKKMVPKVLNEKPASHRLELEIGYFGNKILDPGLRLGLQYIPNVSTKNQFLLKASIGAYYQYRFMNHYFLSASAGYRHEFPIGLFLESSVGLGYQLAHINTTTYTYMDGILQEVTPAPFSMLMPSLNIGAGYCSKKSGIGYYLRMTIFGEYPINNALIPNAAAELGITLPFSKKGK
jgi:hypothetical protein